MASIAMTTLPIQQLQVSQIPARCNFSSSRATVSSSLSVSGPRFVASRRSVAAFSSPINDKVEQSIKEAEETCADDPASAECKVAWDEVEEISAAASHQRDKEKQNKDPLENFCKENPETDECRVYDN